MSKLLCESGFVFPTEKGATEILLSALWETVLMFGDALSQVVDYTSPKCYQGFGEQFLRKLGASWNEGEKVGREKGGRVAERNGLDSDPKNMSICHPTPNTRKCPSPSKTPKTQPKSKSGPTSWKWKCCFGNCWFCSGPPCWRNWRRPKHFPRFVRMFSNEGFDQKRFIDFAEDFFSHFP